MQPRYATDIRVEVVLATVDGGQANPLGVIGLEIQGDDLVCVVLIYSLLTIKNLLRRSRRRTIDEIEASGDVASAHKRTIGVHVQFECEPFPV